MEENGESLNDWTTLVVDELESKPILGTQLQVLADLEWKNNGVSISPENGSSNNNHLVLNDSKKSSSSSSPEVEFRGSMAERRAAKFGFNASKINVAKFKVSSPPSSSPVRSPYLTIPGGISPAALLDSPIMLPNSQVQPSPTTGTLELLDCNHDSLALISVSPAANGEDSAIHSSSSFKPPGDSASTLPCPLSAESQLSTTSKSPPESRKESSLKSCAGDMPSVQTKISQNMAQNADFVKLQQQDMCVAKNQFPVKGETGMQVRKEDKRGTNPTAIEMTRNAEDGYSWRKYGQKHVKGSEYPRSYYKCNNSSCPVKKKVERSHDGEITEIIYKGAHNHPKPHPRISLVPPAPSTELLETIEGCDPCLKLESEGGWRLHNQMRNKDFRAISDWRPDGLERTSSASVLTEILDPLLTTQGKSAKIFGLAENAELASAIACQDGEVEDGATQGSTSQGDEADGDESEPKRRKKEVLSTEAYLPSRPTREPRVIVQIESEIDVLDDGYRWRKYGQKVVKGNPNPRSYYKCTSAGCSVRKHVERASDDIKSVLTTYEGKHNHEVPTAKTSGSPISSNLPPHVSDPNPTLTALRNPNASNQEMQVQDLPLHYEMKPALGTDFMRSNLLGDYVSDHMLIGASSIYQMKFPSTPLQSSLTYGPFLFSSNGNDNHKSCQKFSPTVPDFPISMPTNVPRSSMHVPLSNSFHSYSHNHAIYKGSAIQSFLGDQHINEGDLRFLRPKEEKDDSLYDTSLASPGNANVTSSTVFCKAIGDFPP